MSDPNQRTHAEVLQELSTARAAHLAALKAASEMQGHAALDAALQEVKAAGQELETNIRALISEGRTAIESMAKAAQDEFDQAQDQLARVDGWLSGLGSGVMAMIEKVVA